MTVRANNHAAELSDTKRKLLDVAAELMRSKGYNATTVDDVCAAAGVTKGGFFHYFKSKEDIAKAALMRFYGACRTWAKIFRGVIERSGIRQAGRWSFVGGKWR